MSTVDSDSIIAAPLSESTSHSSRSKLKRDKSKNGTWLESFQQQKFEAWQPIFTAKTVSPSLFLFGIIFIPIGAYLWVISDQLQEIQIPYERCLNTLTNPPEDFNRSCADIINNTETALVKNCKCRIAFNISQEIEGNVYVYYGLTNFFQNHRLYVTSRDNKQLRGDWGTLDEPRKPSRECREFDYEETGENEENRRIYLPCGAIANSMFSDQIRVLYKLPGYKNTSDQVEVPLNRTGISWSSDKMYKFNNSDWFDTTNFSDPKVQKAFAKPKAWRRSLWELDTENPDNNGMKNEDLINWMRTAALPNFRKLYRIVNRNKPDRPEFFNGLPAGEYILEIDYAFPVTSFHGTKSIIFTPTSSLGLHNRFLGITYVIVGQVCIVLGVFLLVVHLTSSRKNTKVVHVD